MKSKLLAAFALTLILLAGRATGASEWTAWSPLQGHSGGKDDQVEGRSILDESSLAQGSESGYRFYYELRNLSSTETAKVILRFPASGATATYELLSGGTASGSGISPNPVQLDIESQITWEEPKVSKQPDPPDAGDNLPSASTPSSDTGSDHKNDSVLGLPLGTDSKPFAAALADDSRHYTALLAYSKPDRYENTPEGMAKFVRDMEGWSADLREDYGRHIKIVSSNDHEVFALIEDTIGSDLSGFFSPADGNARVIKLTRLDPNSSGENADTSTESADKPTTPTFQGNGPIPTESPAEKEPKRKPSALPAASPKTAPTAAPQTATAPASQRHEGYWWDPDDEAADDPDPMIYVRLQGVATRVRLSVAQKENGVPADATPENMTVYREKLKKIITNRHTQKRS